jgi:small conductance mechanosensitive channel
VVRHYFALGAADDTSAEPPLEPALETVEGLYQGFLRNLPLIGIALALAVVGIVLTFSLTSAARRGLERTKADPVAVDFTIRILRILGIILALLAAFALAGVQVGPALAGIGLAGLAVAFAVQSILENFIAGIILLVRRPFRAGDQIRTGDYEGTVQDIDLRVTRLIDYDGVLVLIPNVDVYTNPVINLTRRGKRRTVLSIGVDYRDDHDAAREVIRGAVRAVEGVLDDPPPEVLLTELGESSVDFDVRYWTRPDIRSVRHTQDAVLSAAKRAIEDAGMTIPWPIRTLVVDGPVALDREGQVARGEQTAHDRQES